MKRQFLPYYLSRAALSLALGFLVLGFTWKAVLLASVFLGLFILYLHSGWFQIDEGNALFPLRRDERGREVQRRAMIAGIVGGVVVYLIVTVNPFGGLPQSAAGPLALAIAVCAYFAVQFFLFARS